MKIHEKYVVYEFNQVMGSGQHLALAEVVFKGYRHNSFETEKEAIQALVDDEMNYENYIILKQVYIN